MPGNDVSLLSVSAKEIKEDNALKLSPGKTSSFHRHAKDSFQFLSSSHTVITNPK